MTVALIALPFFVWGLYNEVCRIRRLLERQMQAMADMMARREARELGYNVEDPFAGRAS